MKLSREWCGVPSDFAPVNRIFDEGYAVYFRLVPGLASA